MANLKSGNKELLMTLPNQLTILRMLLTPVFAVLLTFEDLSFKYWALAVFIVASLTDWYDGHVARKYGWISESGKYLDPLADKLLVSSAFGIFAYLDLISFWMFWAMALRDVIITALRAYALSANKTFETSNFAKWKTATQMIAIYVVLVWIIFHQHIRLVAPQPAWFETLQSWQIIWNMMLLVTIYTVATGIKYLLENRPLLKSCYRIFVPTKAP